MQNYSIGDFLIRLKNASMAGKRVVDVPKTKLILSVAQALKKGGYISDVKEEEGSLKVQIKYHKKSPILMDVVLVSKPGLRVYMSVDEMGIETRGAWQLIVSTSQGVMLSKEAIKKRLGGEVIAKVL